MHPYIPHLLADIEAAHRDEIPYEPKEPISFEEEMEEIENWVEGNEPEHTFGYYCGLNAIDFPPPHQLTNPEIKKVLKAFGHMMSSWNQGINLPKTLPPHIAYTMTIDTLNSKTSIVNSGFMTFDFCSGYAPDCKFGQYCPCLEIWNNSETKNMDNIDTDEYPF